MSAELSPRTLGVIVFLTSLCVTPLEYPGFWLASLGSAAVAAPLAAGALGLFADLVAFAFVRRWADEAGRLPRLYAALLALVVLTALTENLSIYARAAGAVQSPDFPLYYAAAFVSMGALLAGYFGREGAGRAATVTLPLVLGGLLFVYVLPIGNMDWRNLVGSQPTLSAPIGAATICSVAALRGFLAILVWAPHVRDRAQARGPALWGTAAAGLLVALSVLWAQGVFGVAEAVQLRFPFVSAVGTMFWQWLPATSLDAIILVVWQVVAFTVVAVYAAMGTDLLRTAFPGLPHALAFAIAAAPVVVAGYGIPANAVVALTATFNAAVLVVAIAIPALLVLAPRRMPGLA